VYEDMLPGERVRLHAAADTAGLICAGGRALALCGKSKQPGAGKRGIRLIRPGRP